MRHRQKTSLQTTAQILLLMLFIPLAASTPLDFPETPAGERAREIVGLFNGTNPMSHEDYVNTHYAPGFKDAFPMATHTGLFESIRTMHGQLELVEISNSSPCSLDFTLKSGSRDAWLNVSLQVESETPHRISSMGIRPGRRPASPKREDVKDVSETPEKIEKSKQPPEKIVIQDEDWQLLDKALKEKAENNEFSGVVLAAANGTPLFHKAYGYASKRFHAPNRPDTKFNLGSCNKLFTTIAILQMAEKGLLALEDPIGKHLDIFPEDIARKVTIRHLLNMRSGWGDYWGNSTYLAQQNRLRKVSDYMEFIKDMPLDFEPGTNFQHSNTGYNVAGAIIEKLTGMDYYEYIKENIYDRAGMKDSGSFHRDGPAENLAVGYTNMNPNDPDNTEFRWSNTYMMPPRGTPTGGGYSTAEDLLKFDRAFRGHRLLSPAYTDFFFNRLEGRPGDPFIPQRMYRAAGGAPGISALIGIDMKTGYTVIVLSNYDFPAAMKVAEEITKMLSLQ